jgi:hypothetical protein
MTSRSDGLVQVGLEPPSCLASLTETALLGGLLGIPSFLNSIHLTPFIIRFFRAEQRLYPAQVP